MKDIKSLVGGRVAAAVSVNLILLIGEDGERVWVAFDGDGERVGTGESIGHGSLDGLCRMLEHTELATEKSIDERRAFEAEIGGAVSRPKTPVLA